MLLTCALGAGCSDPGNADESDRTNASAKQGSDAIPKPLPDLWDDLTGNAGASDSEGSSDETGSSADSSGWPGLGSTGPSDFALPQVNGPCPDLVDGYVNVGGATVSLTVGAGPGPMVFYWHGTGTDSSEVEIGLPGATLEVKLTGGIVASFEESSNLGDNTGDLWWFTGDFDAADQILACGIQAGLVDPTRIYSSGYSAGGLQTGAMVFARSGYLASAVVYSGGPSLGGLIPGSTFFSDPSNIPSVLGAHGAEGSDWLVLDFYDGTHAVEDAGTGAGGYAIDCDDGGDHAIAWFVTRAGVGGMAWQFLKDHPFGVRPSSYETSLPFGYPDYCTIVH